MQVNSSAAATDPAITESIVKNNIDMAVAVRARQVDKMQGEAAVQMIQSAAQISSQLDQGRLDVKL